MKKLILGLLVLAIIGGIAQAVTDRVYCFQVIWSDTNSSSTSIDDYTALMNDVNYMSNPNGGWINQIKYNMKSSVIKSKIATGAKITFVNTNGDPVAGPFGLDIDGQAFFWANEDHGAIIKNGDITHKIDRLGGANQFVFYTVKLKKSSITNIAKPRVVTTTTVLLN